MDHEPRFEGRKLSAWMDDPSLTTNEIDRAVRAVGTNAIPQFKTWLLQKPSMLEQSVRWVNRHSPYWSFDYQPSVAANFRAMRGFLILGKQAASAVPWLAAGALKKNQDFEFYLTALAVCGQDGVQALDRLAPDLTPKETGIYVRALAFGIGRAPDLIPRLEKYLRHSDRQIRLRTLWVIQNLRGRCPPELLAALRTRSKVEEDASLRDTAKLLAGELANELKNQSSVTNPQRLTSSAASLK